MLRSLGLKNENTFQTVSAVPALRMLTRRAVSLIVGSWLHFYYFMKQQLQKPTAPEHKRHLFAVMQIIGRQRFMWYFQFQAGLIMPLGGGK